MKLVGKIFWFGMFLVATFLWLVLFEHGPSGFREGVPVEFEKLKTNFSQPVEKKGDPTPGF